MTIIDAHQHIWDLGRARYDWLTNELAPINRTIGFDEIRPTLQKLGIDATILVQAADNEEDTLVMLDAASRYPEIAGVVAYVPLDRPEEAERTLVKLAKTSVVVGVRNLIHDNPDPDWLLRPDVNAGLGSLERARMPFDLVSVLPRHLENLVTVVERHPHLPIVIDHLSKPPIGLENREPWWSLIERVARYPQVYAKVSGLYSATLDPAAWSPDTVRPFLHRALEVFGSERLMYGGDWPMSIMAGGYERVWEGLSDLFDELGAEEREWILGATAQKFYGIDLGREDGTVPAPRIGGDDAGTV